MLLLGRVFIPDAENTPAPADAAKSIRESRIIGAEKRQSAATMRPGGDFELGSFEGIRSVSTVVMRRTKFITSRKSPSFRNCD